MGWRETLAGLLVQYLYPESSFVGLHPPSVSHPGGNAGAKAQLSPSAEGMAGTAIIEQRMNTHES